jgi:hypothetical protein
VTQSHRFLDAPRSHRPLEVIRPLSLLLALTLAGACTSSPAARPGNSETGGAGGSDEGTGGKATSTGGKAGGLGGAMATGGSSGDTGGSPGTGGTKDLADAGAMGGAGNVGDAAPGDAPAPTAGCTGKFCDDFEAATTGGNPGAAWTVHLEKGMLKVDDTRAFSGSRSVHLTHPGAPAAMFMELRQPALPLSGGVVYGRLMYWLEKNPTGQYSHFEIVRGTGALSGTAQAQLNTGAENGKVVVNYEPGDCTKYSKVTFPEKKWACYQWRFDTTKSEIHLWVDGVSVDDVPVAPAGGGCWKAPMVLDTLHVGWESYHGTMPVSLWIDDVAVGDQMIPCPTGMPSKP